MKGNKQQPMCYFSATARSGDLDLDVGPDLDLGIDPDLGIDLIPL